jgi:hypothetical protein
LATAPDGESSEFLGISADVQCERIVKGKDLLEQLTGVTIATFVPPNNRYDRRTLQCLHHAGFSVLSSDLTGEGDRASSLRFFPYVSGRFRHMKGAIRAAIEHIVTNPVIVVMMHASDFVDAGRSDDPQIELSELAKLTRWINSHEVARVRTLTEVAADRPDYDGARLADYQEFVGSWPYKVSPGFLRRSYWPERFYPTRAMIAQAQQVAVFYIACFYSVVALCGAGASFGIRAVMTMARDWLKPWCVVALTIAFQTVVFVTAARWGRTPVFWCFSCAAFAGYGAGWLLPKRSWAFSLGTPA